jgi:hypothetical protein
MSKILVSKAKFEEAVTLWGFEQARSVLIPEGTCQHDWQPQTMSAVNGFTASVYATGFLKCENCGEEKGHLDLLD